MLDRDGGVNSSKRLEQSGEDDFFETSNVGKVVGIFRERSDQRCDRFGGFQRLEVLFDGGVELTKFGRDTLEDILSGLSNLTDMTI